MKQLGEKVGVSESSISQYENGKRQADFETLLKLGEVLDCTVDYLLRGDQTKKDPLADKRQGDLISALEEIGALDDDGGLNPKGRQIVTDLIRNNADMLKKLINEDN